MIGSGINNNFVLYLEIRYKILQFYLKKNVPCFFKEARLELESVIQQNADMSCH